MRKMASVQQFAKYLYLKIIPVRYFLILVTICMSLHSYSVAQPAAEEQEQLTNSCLSDTDLSEQVIIRRTAFGIPHIYAKDVKAAGFALGHVQMEDYGERVAELLLKTRGEWAKFNELIGKSRSEALDNDAASRSSYRRAVETWQYLESDTRDILEGFARGVNKYIQLHPDEFDDWVKPHYTGYDVHARGIVSPSKNSIRKFLSEHGKKEKDPNKNDSVDKVTNEKLPFKDQTVWPCPVTEFKEHVSDEGSNVWAFGPDRTKTGNTILMRNPHLSWDAGYYEAHIKVPGKLNFYGDFRIGGPLGIIGGFNERLGWSTTNNSPDLDEIYSFEADPDHPDHFMLDGASVPLTHDTVIVEFKHGEAIGTETR